jgi:uncharacterized membrane protein YbhN (UPF0104 family)
VATETPEPDASREGGGSAPAWRRVALRALRVAVAVFLVWFLWSRAGIEDLGELVDSLDWRWVLAAAAVVPVALGIRALNLTLLTNRVRRVLGAWQSYRLTLIGVGANLFLPTGVSDLLKAHLGYRAYGSPEDIVLSTIFDKLTAITAVAAMGTVGAIIEREWVLVALTVGVAAVSLAPWVFSRVIPWRWVLRLLAPGSDIDEETMRAAAKPPAPLLTKVVLVSVVGWVATYTVVYLSCQATGVPVSFAYVLAVAPLATIARTIPISAGGVGLGELTMAALFTRAGAPEELAVRAALLSMVLLVLVPGLIGVLLLTLGGARGRS